MNKFGLIALTILFVFIYGYTSTFEDYGSEQKKTEVQYSNIGNSRFLADVEYTEQGDFYRIAIPFLPNHKSPLETPETDIRQLATGSLPQVYFNWVNQDNEDYVIQVSMMDTAMADITEEKEVVGLLDSKNIQVRNDLITDIDLIKVNQETIDVLVGLNQKAEFTVNDNSCTIFVDILK
jgi:hypothetical protein